MPVGERKPMPSPTAQWFSVTRAKAQNRPEDEGVGQAGKRAFADDFGLAEDFPEEIPDALADGEEMEAGSFFDCRIL
jgi:hypothetical protein